MNRVGKLKLNTITSLIYQIASIVSGFVLPRFILQYYGSEVNGLLSSITQFLAIITLCECGVGSVVQTALYKPIAQNDSDEISRIYVSASRFFNKIALILIVYVFLLICIFPNMINNKHEFLFTSVLIIAIAISTFAQYYLGIVYKLIINSAQLVYIQMITGTITTVLNVTISVVLMLNGFSIQTVKISSSIIFLFQPIVYKIVIGKKYSINKHIKYDSEPIKQKWNGLFQHIATVVLENTDVIVLTLFSSLSNVSVYSVYHLVLNGIKLTLISLTTGMKSLLGDMYAREEKDNLKKTFSLFEWVMHNVVIFFYSVAAVLVVPFVKVYTKGILDANYIQYTFGIILCIAMMVYMIRIPYNYMILAAGHYKQTQYSALIETVINIIISIAFVSFFGLVGVAVGTLIAMVYRTIYFVFYLKRNILKRNPTYFFKHIFCDFLCFIMILLGTKWIPLMHENYRYLMLLAIEVSVLSIIIIIFINFMFYKNELISFIKKFK